ncbi:MAG: right-handed parallel beta-helix repeat-containing protein [Terrisporobacter othiniensis]|nr:right-handed parallel beta-helix repeat-containing protein [Terrisporobacter othiniensis]
MTQSEVRSINGREISDNYSRNQLLNKIDKKEVDSIINKFVEINIKYPPMSMIGAKGDGVTDDSGNIKNIIEYAVLNKYKKILFPLGTYLIVNPLTLKGELDYIGDDAVIKLNTETSYLNISENNFTINGITFDANNVVMRALFVNGSENFNIRNSLFKNGTKHGLSIYNGKKIQMYNCKFESSGRNDFMSASCSILGSDVNVSHCEASDNRKGNGFIVYSDSTYKSNNIIFSNCLAKNNIYHGIVTAHIDDASNRVKNIMFNNCTTDGNGGIFEGEYMYGGIVVHDANDVIINGCISRNNYEHGIAVMDADNVSIIGNITDSNKRCGIRLQADWARLPQDSYSGVKNCLITNNQCLNNGIEDKYWSSGILIEGNCHYVTCSNNVINGNYYSIYTKAMTNFSDCTNVYLQNNTMYGNKISNGLTNTMTSGSVFGENFINGTRTKIDTVLNEQAGYVAYNISDKLVSGKLNVENNALYHTTIGNDVINGVTNTNMPVGTTFYICLKSGSDQHSITVNSGNGISLPSTLVISKANANNEVIFKFVKTVGTGFRLIK